MWPNSLFPEEDNSEEILNGKLHFLCNGVSMITNLRQGTGAQVGILWSSHYFPSFRQHFK